MSTKSSSSPARSGASFATSKTDLPGENRLAARTESIRPKFETERCEFNARQLADAGKTEAERREDAQGRGVRRESFMVKRQKPQPVLRPSPALARDVDRAAFNASWDHERQAAAVHRSKDKRKDAFKSKRIQQFTAAHDQGRTPSCDQLRRY